MTLLIEFCLFAFRIKNSRIRCICRYIPMVKLPFDLVIYGIIGYADTFFINLNPFSCKVYVQQLILSLMPDPIRTEYGSIKTVIIPEYIGMQIPPIWMKICIIVFIIISVALILQKMIKIFNSQMTIKKIFNSSSFYTRNIHNKRLQQDLVQSKTQILTSTELAIPIAAYQHYILVPKNLADDLSQDEFEAVVAHEFEHLRWKDPLLKIFCSSVCTLFWWVPTIWWLKKLEGEQEEASDSGLGKYGIDSFFLASAIMKVINNVKCLKITYNLAPTCSLHSPHSNHVKRLEALLNTDRHSQPVFRITEIIGCVLCSLAFISFWIC